MNKGGAFNITTFAHFSLEIAAREETTAKLGAVAIYERTTS
jgi:hypothetical protein